MCDVEFDPNEARRAEFSGPILAALALPRPWSDEQVLGFLSRELPGLCDAQEPCAHGQPGPEWAHVAGAMLRAERSARRRASPNASRRRLRAGRIPASSAHPGQDPSVEGTPS